MIWTLTVGTLTGLALGYFLGRLYMENRISDLEASNNSLRYKRDYFRCESVRFLDLYMSSKRDVAEARKQAEKYRDQGSQYHRKLPWEK